MCYAFDAQPPDLPVGGGAFSTTSLTLQSADGTAFSAYLARPAVPNGAAVVVLPDVRGLFRFYEELAERFAAVGITAIAFDYFGRTAGVGTRDATFDFMPHVKQTQFGTVSADVAAAIAALRAESAVADDKVFTVGFCFGGGHSFLQATTGQGLAGVVGFYGQVGVARFGAPTPTEVAGAFACPVLGLFGGDDPGIPAAAVEQFDAALANAGVPHEIVSYPGAPHSFFDRKQEQFGAESADAWRRILDFIKQPARQPIGV